MQLKEKVIELSGVISRITYQNPSNGWTVLSIQNEKQSITAVGILPGARPNLKVELTGSWIQDKKYGKQFSFTSFNVPQPNPLNKEDIVNFLTSLKHIKAQLAERIYSQFQEQTFQVFDEAPDKLLQIQGIGPIKHPEIIESFNLLRGMAPLISFLSSIGISSSYAQRIFDQYGANSIVTIKENPYILAQEVKGIGFSRADEIARSLDIALDSPVRNQAGILHTLQSATQDGHCFLYKNTLQNKAVELLKTTEYEPDPTAIVKAIQSLQDRNLPKSRRVLEEQGRVYLLSYYEAEVKLATKVRELLASPLPNPDCDVSLFIQNYEQENIIQLSQGQKEAIQAASKFRFTILTGLPGCGKTAVSKAIAKLWQSQNKQVIGVAPTGKAALRLRELTGLPETSTIHRLLEWKGQDKFTYNSSNQLTGDCFLVDEASMLDLKLASAFFQALPNEASVLLVGDVHQLPSVGAGDVLRDLINAGVIPVTKLTQIFRQAATSKIIQAASKINNGELPELELIAKDTALPQTDALFWKCRTDEISSGINYLLKYQLPHWGYTQEQIQILSPIHKGSVGNIELNNLVQRIWNPPTPSKKELGNFREGDRVLQTSNNYNDFIMNGDLGVIEAIDPREEQLLIRFPDLVNPEGKVVEYDSYNLRDLKLGNSISVHKSQGSEFPVVIIPVTAAHFIMLQRNLIYTGVTRAKKLLILVGEEEALKLSIEKNSINKRNTFLRERLLSQRYAA